MINRMSCGQKSCTSCQSCQNPARHEKPLGQLLEFLDASTNPPIAWFATCLGLLKSEALARSPASATQARGLR